MASKNLIKVIAELLASFSKPQRFLLGLSGGPDSRALLHALLELKKIEQFSLGVAHIDHGWRKESGEEAFQLEQWMRELEIPFFLYSLKGKKLSGNLEAACRDERLQFFSHICRLRSYQAVLLAHHQDDLAETVLKRILEGAGLSSLSGMEMTTYWEDLTVLRPWLGVSKTEILDYIHHLGLPFFDDPTNLDLRFLRGRMRSRMIPDLESQFGKSIRAPLARLSTECQDLNAYMHKKWPLCPWKKNYLECDEITTPFEIRWLLRKWIKTHNLELSCDVITKMVQLILKGKSDRRFLFQNHVIEVDRKKLFIIPKISTPLPEPLLLKKGKHSWGPWSVEVKQISPEFRENMRWNGIFLGEELVVGVPEGDCYLEAFERINGEDKKKWQKMRAEAKTPAFLRPIVPLILHKGYVIKDFFLYKKNQDISCNRSVHLIFQGL